MNDYIAGALARERMTAFEREVEHDQLVRLAHASEVTERQGPAAVPSILWRARRDLSRIGVGRSSARRHDAAPSPGRS